MKKLYLLFAFLFALIGYQDAGAKTIYLDISDVTWWTSPCFYGMNSNSDHYDNPDSGAFTSLGNNRYSAKVDDKWNGFIISNNKNNNLWDVQTVDVFSGLTDGATIKISSEKDGSGHYKVSIVSGGSDDKYYLHTNILDAGGSWTTDNCELTHKSGTVYEKSGVEVKKSSGNYMIKCSDGTYYKGNNAKFTMTSSDDTKSITLVKDGNNDNCEIPVGTYTFSFDTDSKTFTATREGVEEAETISTVHFKGSNGYNQQLDLTGGNYSHAINPALTADYWFEIVTSKGTRSYYYVTDGPVDTNNKQYTVAKGTSSSNNFKFDSDKVEAVTQVIANVSGLAITTAQFAITPKTVSATKYYLHTNLLDASGSWTATDGCELTLKSDNVYEKTGVEIKKTSGNYMIREVGSGDSESWHKATSDLSISDSDETKSITLNGGNNGKDYCSEIPTGSYTITYNSSTKVLTFTREDYVAPAATDVYLMKGGSEFCKLTYLDNCHYSANFPTVDNKTIDLTASYAIKVVKGSDVTTYHLSGTTSVDQLEHNYGFVTGGSAFSFDTDAIAEVKSVIVHLTSATDATNAPCVKFAGEAVIPAETVTAISLNYGGNNNSNPLYNNPASFTKSADGNWALASTAVTTGDGNPYYLSVTTNKSTYRYMVDDASDAKYYIKSAQSYNVKSDSNTGHAFVFTGGTGFDFTSGSVTGTVTIGSDGLPATMTFSNYTGSTPVGGSDWVAVGTWNNFSKTASPMTDEGNGVYTLTLTLKGSGVMFLYNTSTSKQWSDNGTDFDGTAVKNRTLCQYTDETKEPKDNITYSSLKSGEYKITWNSSTSKFSIASTAAEPQIVVNMPLKKSDFANGKKHYFVVGTRMGAWRLQPEWELKANSDGSYSLPNRLMYAGYFMIAEVDSYDNYIKQSYKAYSNTSLSENYMTSSHASVNLSQVNPDNQATSLGSQYWTSYRYGSDDGDTRKQFGDGNGNIRNKTIRFIGSDGKEPNVEDNMWHCAPNLVDIKVSMSNGHPSKVEFSYNNNNNAVNEALTFTIAGSAFRNFGLDPENTDYTTPRLASGDINELGWQEGWIQFDANAEPYVDAYGEFLYQTVWQKSWLNTHPTRFVNKRGFEFSGDNLTFTYDADRTAERTSNTFSRAVNYWQNDKDETGVAYTDIVMGDDKMCYVAEDVWIRGAFKIWTGWGGSSVDGQGNGSKSNAALWFDRNGGHQIKNHDRVVYGTPDNNMTYFKTYNNIGAADFAIGVEHNNGVATDVANDGGTTGNLGDDDGTLVFLKRIELWWDPEKGFDNSVLYFEKELGAPVIRIDRMSKTTLGYSYKIQDANADDIVAEAKIELLKVTTDADGNETRTVAGTVRTWNEQIHATEFYNYLDEESYQEWDNELEPGDYRMKISVRYLNSTEFKTNISNKSTIREYVNPVALKLTQPTDDQGRLTFNLKIDSEALNIALANGEEAPASISYYSVTVPGYLDEDEEVEAFRTALLSNNNPAMSGTFEAEVTEVNAAGERVKKTVELERFDYGDDGTMIFNVQPLGRADKYKMPSLTLYDMVPGKEYEVTVKMYGNDGDDQPWDDIFVSEGSAKITLTAPAATIDGPDVILKNEVIDWEEHFDEVPAIHARQNVRHGHVYEHETADDEQTYVAVETFGGAGYGKNLTRANYFNVNMNIPALNVADEVLDKWNVKVNFNIERFHFNGETRAVETYVYTVPNGSSINNGGTNTSVDINYLPLNIEQKKIAELDNYKGNTTIARIINGSNGAKDDPVYDAPLATQYKVSVSTTYERVYNPGNNGETTVTVDRDDRDDEKKEIYQIAELYNPDKAGSLVAYPGKFMKGHGIQLHQRSAAKWYDAFNVIGIGDLTTPHVASPTEENPTEAPVHSFGFFITNGTVTQWYDRNEPQHKMYPGGHVLNTADGSPNGYALEYQVLSTLPTVAHFGETVAAMGDNAAIPVLIGNIGNVTKPRYDSNDDFYDIDADDLTGNVDYDLENGLVQKAKDIKGYLFTSYPLLQTPRLKGHVYAEVMITDNGKSDEAKLLDKNDPMAQKARRMAAATRDAAVDHVDPTDPALLTLELPAAIANNDTPITTEVMGIVADAQAGDLTVFPNPAVDVVTVSASSMIGKVEIVSVDGSLVKTAEIDDTTGKLDVSDVAKGLYLVRTAAGTVRLIVK